MEAVFRQAEYVSWSRRLAAWILDFAVFSAAYFGVLVVLALVTGDVLLEGLPGAVVFGLCGLLWEVGWIAGASAKPGHRMTGIRIRVVDGRRVSVDRAAVRWTARTLNYVLLGLEALVSAITIAASSRRQSVHDLVARTVAVTPAAAQRVAVPLRSPDADTAPPAKPEPRPGPLTSQDDVEPPTRGPFL